MHVDVLTVINNMLAIF